LSRSKGNYWFDVGKENRNLEALAAENPVITWHVQYQKNYAGVPIT